MQPWSVGDAVAEIQRGCGQASTLHEACSAIVGFAVDQCGISRAALVVGWDDHVEGSARGATDLELGSLLAAVRSGDVRLTGEQAEPGPNLLAHPAGSILADFSSCLVLPLDPHSSRFLGALIVDADRIDERVAFLGDVLRRSSSVLAQCAELEVARDRLHEEEERSHRFRAVLDTLTDPVLVTDQDHQILLANRRAEELLFSEPHHGPGRRHAVERNNLFFSAFRTTLLLSMGAPSERELFLVNPVDGSDLLFEVLSLPSSPGLPGDSIIYLLRNITDLKRATAELETQINRSLSAEHQARRESERLNVIIENAGVPILVTDDHSNIVLMNRDAERLFEMPAEASSASPKVRTVRANDAKVSGLISDFLLQSRPRREEQLTLVDPDGARAYPVQVVSTKIVNRRGEPTAVVSVLHDLTGEVENERLARELKGLNEELEQRIADATRELEARNLRLEIQSHELGRTSRLKSEFLATMSHELRTPINAILGYNSLLRDGIIGNPSDEQLRALERVHASSQHLLSIINDILDLSKVEAGHVTLNPVDVEIPELVESISEAVRPLALGEDLEYKVDLAPALSTINIDVTRLRQILLNLLSNAVKFTPSGSVTLRVLTPTDRTVRFEVEDTGIGIKPEDLDAIFEEFRQVDQSQTRKYGGTGLGLTICRRLGRLMGGALSVDSTPGVGSVFRIDLPTEQGDPRQDRAESEPPDATRARVVTLS